MRNDKQGLASSNTLSASEKIPPGTFITTRVGEPGFFKKGERGVCLGDYRGTCGRVPHYVFAFEGGMYTDVSRGEANRLFIFQSARSSKLENYQFKHLRQVADDVASGLFRDVWEV